jgi:hypothetical protein
MDATRVKLTGLYPPDLAEALRDAVYWLQGPPTCLRLAGLLEDAARAELARLQRVHRAGAPFPARPAEAASLPPGPRPGGRA